MRLMDMEKERKKIEIKGKIIRILKIVAKMLQKRKPGNSAVFQRKSRTRSCMSRLCHEEPTTRTLSRTAGRDCGSKQMCASGGGKNDAEKQKNKRNDAETAR